MQHTIKSQVMSDLHLEVGQQYLVQPLTWLLLVTLGAYGIIPLTWSFSKRNVAGF